MRSQSAQSLETITTPSNADTSERSRTAGASNAVAAERVERATAGGDPQGDTPGVALEHLPVEAGSALNAHRETPTRAPGAREVCIQATEDDPLCVAGVSPAESDLYDERPVTADVCDPGWEVVQGVRGSVACPSRTEALVENPLFVDGAPAVADVNQGRIGDCYLLAALTGLVAADPGRLAEMVQVSGTSAVVTLFRMDDATGLPVATPITVGLDLAHSTDEAGNRSLHGAGFRRSEAPVLSEWYAQVLSDDLWVCEHAYYEAAMWVPLVEKAYARFAERYGQYGGFPARESNAQLDAHGNARSGYEQIEGGLVAPVMQVLQGAKDPRAVEIGWGDHLDTDRMKWVLRGLLRQRGDGAVPGRRAVTTVSSSEESTVARLRAAIAQNDDPSDRSALPEALRRLEELAEGWQGAPDGSTKDAAQVALVREARKLRLPEVWADGHGGQAGARQALRELVLVVANFGDDEGSSERHIYANHEYTVLGSRFRDLHGVELPVHVQNLDAILPLIDPARSEVDLRNPHGGNSPDLEGGLQRDDGRFTLTLEQYLRSFDVQTTVGVM